MGWVGLHYFGIIWLMYLWEATKLVSWIYMYRYMIYGITLKFIHLILHDKTHITYTLCTHLPPKRTPLPPTFPNRKKMKGRTPAYHLKNSLPIENPLTGTIIFHPIDKNVKRKKKFHFRSAGVSACTMLVPSLNLVRKIRFAFWNMPSFKLTTINWLPLNRVFIRRPMFWVWLRSRAASTSSRMYIGAGLNWRRARMRERAIRDLLFVRV